MNKDKYTCPVCGNPNMKWPPELHNHCRCCGTQFGYDDYGFTHEELRKKWINSGAEWWYKKDPPPPGWDPFEQMRQAGLPFEEDKSLDNDANEEA